MSSPYLSRNKKSASGLSLVISLTAHALIITALFYFAAREGLLGKELKKIAVEMVKSEKPEEPKEPEKVEEAPPVEPPKIEEAKVALAPPPQAPPPQARVAPSAAPPIAAPPAISSAFVFEGGKLVQTSSDPTTLYKSAVEYAVMSRWERPSNVEDSAYVAEVEVSVDRAGQLSVRDWKKRSESQPWNNSVEKALAAARALNRPPPTNFPPQFVIRFDVHDQVESLTQ